MRTEKTIAINSALISLKALENGQLALMDQNGTFRQIELQDYQTVDGFKSNIAHEHSWGNHLSISASGKYVVSTIPHTNKAILYSVESKKALHTITRHKGDIESVCVDDDNHYFVTGGTDGKTFVWNLEMGHLVYAFPPRSDYITALDLNSVWVISASYDKTISVLNLTKMQVPIQLIGHSSAIVQVKLLKRMRMISADKEGNILLWDLKTAKVLNEFPQMHEEITTFTVSMDERFLFVGSKLGNISLYDIQKASRIKKSYLKEESKITSLCLLEQKGQLVVGTKRGDLSFYSLFEDEEVQLQWLRSKEYTSLYMAAENNPILTFSKVYITLEKIFEGSMKKAIKMLEKGQQSNAKAILEPFTSVKEKQPRIHQLFHQYSEFHIFFQYVKERRYALAYPMANQRPHFKKSDPYRIMENDWHIQFNKAKALILKKDGEEKAREILFVFKGISSKSLLIKELFDQRTVYILFLRKLAKKDFSSIFSLVQRSPFIKEFDEYDKLTKYADNLFIKADRALDNKAYDQVVELAQELMLFPEFTKDAKDIMNRAMVFKTFAKAAANNKRSLMYEMMDKNPCLMDEKEAGRLDAEWDRHLRLAEKYASKGDAVNASMALESFFDVKTKHFSIAAVMQQAYSVQLQGASKEKVSDASILNGVRQYLQFFGIDDHIEEFCENIFEYTGHYVDLSKFQKGDIMLFRPSSIISDIRETR